MEIVIETSLDVRNFFFVQSLERGHWDICLTLTEGIFVIISCFLCFLCQAQSMDEEREMLNRRISVLMEKLADAKFANSVETFNVRSLSPS